MCAVRVRFKVTGQVSSCSGKVLLSTGLRHVLIWHGFRKWLSAAFGSDEAKIRKTYQI